MTGRKGHERGGREVVYSACRCTDAGKSGAVAGRMRCGDERRLPSASGLFSSRCVYPTSACDSGSDDDDDGEGDDGEGVDHTTPARALTPTHHARRVKTRGRARLHTHTHSVQHIEYQDKRQNTQSAALDRARTRLSRTGAHVDPPPLSAAGWGARAQIMAGPRPERTRRASHCVEVRYTSAHVRPRVPPRGRYDSEL